MKHNPVSRTKVDIDPPARHRRFRVVYDEDPDLSDLEQWDTPDKYRGYEIVHNGEPLTFADYICTYGDPSRHVVYGMIHEEQCSHCGNWFHLSSLWNIDFMDWEDPGPGTYETTDEIDNECLREIAEELEEYG